jgi:hypothetical protein
MGYTTTPRIFNGDAFRSSLLDKTNQLLCHGFYIAWITSADIVEVIILHHETTGFISGGPRY